MKDVWNKDPAEWEVLSLIERLEAMRRWHCTGPSGQCAASMNTRETLNRTIREAQRRIKELEEVVCGGVCNFQNQPCGECEQCKKVREVLASR